MAMTPEEVLEQLKASGISGRGGAGFAMGTKVSFLPKGSMDKYLVCNADESEPGTFKDRELMQKTPHTLIEGIIIASYAAGANRSFIYIRGEYVLQADMLDAALHEAREAGYVGENILDSGHSLSLIVHRGAGAYICGEETGLLDSLEGKRGNPRLKPPFPANQGLYQGPTLINNVETLPRSPRSSRWAARSTPSSAWRPPPAPSSYPSPATCSARATTRSSWASPRARSSTGWPAARRRGARSSAGSPAAPPRRCSRRRTSTSPTTSTRSPKPARCSARARSSSSTTPRRSWTWR